LCRFQVVSQMGEPARMGEVAGCDKINALNGGPSCQALQIAGLAGGTGVAGVDVEVGDVWHIFNLLTS
ncbi:MAG: hypothetical protein D3916_01205, partial [Candidatus Electrothrix sp. MAN1_4]|nr:hypothetical protein [Candidatus Electrothrix sp. MAN1_4]